MRRTNADYALLTAAPDFSGIWLAGSPLPCPPFLRDGNDCIEKIGLSRQTANIGMDLREREISSALSRQIR
jgi:hypothetical protein